MDLVVDYKHTFDKTSTKNTILVPYLYGYVLHKIVLGDNYNIDIVVRLGSSQNNDLVKMNSAFFMHTTELLLDEYLYKVKENDKIYLDIKGNNTSKNFDALFHYHYKPTDGFLYHQCTMAYHSLDDANTLLQDISQQLTPIKLKLKTDNSLYFKQVALIPRFSSSMLSNYEYMVEPSEKSNVFTLDFYKDVSSEINQLLSHYKLSIKLEDLNGEPANANTQLYVLVYGAKP